MLVNIIAALIIPGRFLVVDELLIVVKGFRGCRVYGDFMYAILIEQHIPL